MIQALYFCQPFREKILQYKQQSKRFGNQRDNLLTCLADLFVSIANQKRRVGTIAPKRFVTKLKKENGSCFVVSFKIFSENFFRIIR